MNWIQQNKFVTILTVIVVIGVGVLGFLLSQAMAGYAQVSSDYASKSSELQASYNGKPFPDSANVNKKQTLKTEYAESVQKLLKDLSAFNVARENVVPNEFQNILRESVNRLKDSAGKANVQLPANFYMGFEKYENSLPSNEAAPVLAQVLRGVEKITTMLTTNRVISINGVTRGDVSEESPNGGGAPKQQGNPQNPPKPGNQKNNARRDSLNSNLFRRYPFEVSFRADNNAFRTILNEIVSQKAFFVVRALEVSNDTDKGPTRSLSNSGGEKPPEGGAGSGAVPSQPTGSNPPAAGGTKPLEYVLGMEKVNVTMKLEMVIFASELPPNQKNSQPAAAPAPANP